VSGARRRVDKVDLLFGIKGLCVRIFWILVHTYFGAVVVKGGGQPIEDRKERNRETTLSCPVFASAFTRLQPRSFSKDSSMALSLIEDTPRWIRFRAYLCKLRMP
jgi:hypothetical protein